MTRQRGLRGAEVEPMTVRWASSDVTWVLVLSEMRRRRDPSMPPGAVSCRPSSRTLRSPHKSAHMRCLANSCTTSSVRVALPLLV